MPTIVYTAHGTYPGKKLSGIDRYKKLYHYTTFDKFPKIWDSKELWFGAMENVNDIFEQGVSVSSSNPKHQFVFRLFDRIFRSYRRISFTMDFDTYFWGCMSPMLWGQYASKGHGVCIEIDSNKLYIPKTCLKGIIHYKKAHNPKVELDHSIKFERDIYGIIRTNRTKLFFTKEDSWSKENEYRIVSNDLHHLDIAQAITNIIVTEYHSIEVRIIEGLVDEYNKANGTDIGVKYVHYVHPNDSKISLPVLSDTLTVREQFNESCDSQFARAIERAMQEKWGHSYRLFHL